MNCFGEDGLQHAGDKVFDEGDSVESIIQGCFQSGVFMPLS